MTPDSRPIAALRRWKLRFYNERRRFRLRATALGMPAFSNALLGFRSVIAPQRTLLTYPGVPELGHILGKLCALLGYVCTNDPKSGFDFAWYFEDTTCSAGSLPVDVDPARTFNARCLNIGKGYIAQVFEEVFGYSLAIDPTTYVGLAAVKSNQNALHDGRTIQCPIAPTDVRADCVYQQLVDNETGPGTVTDLRVVIHRARLPLVYRKFRPTETRYSNTNARVELCQPEDIFSVDERAQLLRFGERIGMDFGELDVLRDRNSGKIYVVDANNTPTGPPNGLSEQDSARALHILLDSFQQLFTADPNRDA